MATRAAKKKTIEIVQVRSGIGAPEMHKRTLRSLGLHRPHQRVIRPDNAAVRGMVASISHLVKLVAKKS